MTFALIPYDDGSGPRLKVALGHTTSDGEKTLRITGMGEATIHVADLDVLIGALRAAKHHIDWNDE